MTLQDQWLNMKESEKTIKSFKNIYEENYDN